MLTQVEMPLADFHTRLRKHRYELQHGWDSAFPVYEQFAQEKNIYPEHCDQVRSAIFKMRSPVRKFHQLLNTSSQLPLTVLPKSFSPAMTLRQVDELTDELMILILLFRKVCPASSQEMKVLHEEIVSKLHALAQGYEDILHHADRLLLHVLAQEKEERQKLRQQFTVLRLE